MGGEVKPSSGKKSEFYRVELTRPLRVESGRASPPGVDLSRRRPDRRDLRRERPRLPEPSLPLVRNRGTSLVACAMSAVVGDAAAYVHVHVHVVHVHGVL